MIISFRILVITLTLAFFGFVVTNNYQTDRSNPAVKVEAYKNHSGLLSSADTQSVTNSQENEVLGIVTEYDISLQDLPFEFQPLFTKDSLLKMDKITRTDFQNGQIEWKWAGSSTRNLRESFTGWRSRLAKNWVLKEGKRTDTDGNLIYKNYTSEVRVSLKVQSKEVLQTISIIQSK